MDRTQVSDQPIEMVINGAALIIMLPGVVIHEAAHAVTAKLVGGDIHEISLLPPSVTVEYEAGTNTLGIRLAAIAPTVVGILLLPLLAWFYFNTELIVFMYALACWFVITVPMSQSDRNPLGAEN